jgi:hypothetical protein
MMRHIVYLSKTKLDLYHAQIPERFLSRATARLKFNIGVISAEIEAGATEARGDYRRLLEIIRYLEDQSLLGSEIESKPFVQGSFVASALLDLPRIFFSGVMTHLVPLHV